MKFCFEDEIVLENEIALLRPVMVNDIENLQAAALANPLLLQYSPRPVHSMELLTQYIHNAIAERERRTRYSFSIFSKLDRSFAGSTAFLNISDADDRLEIGASWLGPAFQGTGLNKECKKLLLTYAFHHLTAHRVEFRTDERNLQSRRAIEKIGGIPEGVLREHTVLHDGFRRNTCCYRILRTEWKEE